MSHNGSASCVAKNQDCIHSADPAEYGCHLTVSFYNEWEQNAGREIEGNIQMILAPGDACGGGELVASRCG